MFDFAKIYTKKGKCLIFNYFCISYSYIFFCFQTKKQKACRHRKQVCYGKV